MLQPRRVLYLDHTSVLAGGEIALLELVRHLDRGRYVPVVGLLSDGPLAGELAKAGVETHIIAAGRELLETRKDSLGGKSLLRGGAIVSAAASVWRIRKLIRQVGCQLVHANSLKSDCLGGLAARLAGKPVIWHIRDRVESDYLSPSATRVIRTLARFLPTHIIANSHSTLETLKLRNPTKGTAIYSGLDLTRCACAPSGANGSPRIGIVGRITPWKGQHVFLNAAAIVRNKFQSATFQIVGSPLFSETEYEAGLHKLAEKLGISNVTEFTGQRNDVPELMAAMDVVVHASVTPEPFGQVVVLAMACGKPVVATDGGGVRETVVNGKTGLLVPMNDAPAMAAAIERILSRPDWASELGQNARQRALENFTIERTVNQTMDLYDRLLGSA